MARSSDIRLADGLDQVGKQLGKTNSLIGAALRLLTDEVGNEATLRTSLRALVRVLDAVNWYAISKGNPDAWLYFYEDFLAVYDNALRKLTGSYYTPPEVVGPMDPPRGRRAASRLRPQRRFGIGRRNACRSRRGNGHVHPGRFAPHRRGGRGRPGGGSGAAGHRVGGRA